MRGWWFLALLPVFVGCDPFGEPGPPQTTETRVEFAGAVRASVRIDMPGGLLEVSGGAEALVEAQFLFDTESLRPVLRRTMESDRALIEVTAPGYQVGVGRTRNEWALKLSDACPLDLELAMRAGRADLALSGLPLGSIDFNVGGGELIVDLGSAPLAGNLTGQLELGHGKLLLKLPAGAGLRVRVWKSVGTLEVRGLTQDPKHPEAWVNPSFESAPLRIDLTARVGWGDLEVVAPD